jgi:hypothetical protein
MVVLNNCPIIVLLFYFRNSTKLSHYWQLKKFGKLTFSLLAKSTSLEKFAKISS